MSFRAARRRGTDHLSSTERVDEMFDYKTMRRRLVPDTWEELDAFIEAFRNGTMPASWSGMERHFAIAKEKPESFRNHGSVLAVSIGGTNTKAMLASMRDGRLWVEDVRAVENPAEPTHFDDYLDSVLGSSPRIEEYLRSGERIAVGFSIPMLLIEGCPYHPTKVPTVTGFIARSEAEICEELNLNNNFRRYLRSRGYSGDCDLFYQSDGIVAHHGAVSLSDAGVRDKTVLCICGTGMANGDERHYLPIAYLTVPEDDELFPPEETENRQLNYAIAGKGIFGLMRRAIGAAVALGGSAMEGKGLERYFEPASATRTVFELCRNALDPAFTTPETEELRRAAGEEGYRELLELSELIAERDVETLSNSILSTMLSMGAAPAGGKNYIYLEGSIARNPVVKPRLLADLKRKLAARAWTDFEGNAFRPELVEDPPLYPLTGPEDAESKFSMVDTTLVGTATMVMAEACAKAEDER